MKRLLCIINNMNAGGAETFLMKLYRNIDRTNYQMDFCINVKEKCFYEDEILALGGRIFRIPTKSESVKEFKKQLASIVKNEHYEYVMRVTSSAMGFMDLKIAKKAGARVCCARSSNSSDGDSFKAKIVHKLGRLLYGRYVDVAIAPSDLAAKYTFGNKAYRDGKISILHNAVDLDVFKFDPVVRAQTRELLGLPSDATVYGHIGRFMTQKNHTFLLDVFCGIAKKDKNAVLLLVGDGILQEDIKKKAQNLSVSDKVIFAGIRSDVPAVLCAMDVFVFPSFYEGMPNTVIEAQATGLPCVIADTITKEADITGLVEYLPLSKDTDMWVECAIKKAHSERKNTKEHFINHRYNIDAIAKEFQQLIFG